MPRASLLLALLALTTVPAVSPAQSAPAEPPPSYLKVGGSSLLGIPMVGVERPLRRAHRSFQWDVMLSPWASVDGFPLQFVVGTAEWRFHRRATRTGWYTGVNVGGAIFRLRRPDYADTTLYQEGVAIIGGVSLGHVWALRSGLTVDAYVGGGPVQSLYKGYDKLTGSRYDGAKLWNVSGEWFPYRVGAMVGVPRRRPR